MRAWSYIDGIGLDRLQLVDQPDPRPGAGEVLLRMKAVALNYRDLAIASGYYHIGVSAPLIPASDGAGEVVEVGPAVTRFKVGDLVCPTYLPDWIDGPSSARVAGRRLGGPTDGVLRELMVLSEQDAVLAPKHLSPVEAAALPVAPVTAWHSLFHIGRVRPGETVLVQGAGGVSTAAIQFARISGARVVVVTRNTQHADRLRQLGAHEVVAGDGDWPQRVLALTGGVNVAVNVAGGETIAAMITTLASGGQIHQVGYASSTQATIDIYDAIRHATTWQTATAGSRLDFENMNRAMHLHDLHPAIAETHAFDRLGDALASLKRGGHLGKIVVTF